MENLDILQWLYLLASYLLGSFSSAITLSKIMGFADPRSEGSNNPGATNVMRIAGRKAAALTLLGDLLKGFIPVLIATYLFQQGVFISLVGVAAFLGHCYPVFYQFRGGKGVATAIGFILAFHWLSGLILVAIWLIVAKIFKLSSLAALIAFLTLPPTYYLLQGNVTISFILLALTVILVFRHKDNIVRLLRGDEK